MLNAWGELEDLHISLHQLYNHPRLRFSAFTWSAKGLSVPDGNAGAPWWLAVLHRSVPLASRPATNPLSRFIQMNPASRMPFDAMASAMDMYVFSPISRA